MKYEDKFEIEFIRRTLELKEQYEQGNITPDYSYTLLVNLCVGLLFIPREIFRQYESNLSSINIKDNNFGIALEHIDSKDKSLYSIVRNMRNAIAHNDFTLISEDNKYITHIKLDGRSFHATFPISDFINFVTSIAKYTFDNILTQTNMSNNNGKQ